MSEGALDESEREDAGSIVDEAVNEGDPYASDANAAAPVLDRKVADSKTKKQPNLPSLIASKISELEKENTRDEEEEKEIARAVKAEHRKLSTLVSETDTEIGKVTLLQRKYTSLFQDMQRLEREHARQRSKSEKSSKEFSASKIELNKAVNMKHKLETLCRELQKENKRVKEDSKRLAQSEQQKRVELNNKFETTIFEIKTKMDEDSGAAGKRRFEDNELKDKFKSFLEQYELREQHFHATLRTKELEVQLNQACAEKFKKTSDLNEQRAKTLHSQVSTFSETESELRSQLNIYVEKFKQVEDTLNNSNDLFLNFRKEMETMTKKTKKLEKENALIRSKCDTANKSILEMAEERAKYRKEIETLKQKSTKLENLCRALQTERSRVNPPSSGSNQNGSTTNGQPRNGTSDEANQENKGQNQAVVHDDEPSEGSLADDYSEASFDIDDHGSIGQPPRGPLPNEVILGFLKVSNEEEKLIREKRLEYGQETHANPDRDTDGYLAVSALEKEFIGALRDSRNAQFGPSRPPDSNISTAQSNAAEIAGKFNLFSKVFSGSVPFASLSGAVDERTFTPEERKLYDEAAARLSAMTQKFFDRETGSTRDSSNSKESSTDMHTRQLEAFKKQMSADKLKDFSTQYDQMLLACRSLVTSPETMPQTYEALMTSMAILLSENDLADLRMLYEKSRTM